MKYTLFALTALSLAACGPDGPSEAELCRADGGSWEMVGSHTEWRSTTAFGPNGQVSLGAMPVEVTDWVCVPPR